jgi:hypothetical protein
VFPRVIVSGKRALIAGVALAATMAIAVVVLADGDQQPTAAGGFAFIRSAPGDRAVIWAVGDGADGGAAGRRVVALIADQPHDRVLYLGDVYENGTAEEFTRNYQTTYGRLARVTAPTPGNHDWSNEDSGYAPYWRRQLGVGPEQVVPVELG